MNSYRQFCGVARALDLVGERWTLLVVRDLLLGARSYTELERSLSGISPSVLSGRLRRLRDAGLVTRGASKRYSLTESGRALEPVVLALGGFGARYLDAPRPDDRLDPRWAMLSLKRRFGRAGGSGTAEFVVGASEFTVTWAPRGIDVADGPPRAADVSVRGPMPAWFGLLSGRSDLPSARAAGMLVEGSEEHALDLLRALGARVA